MSEEIQDRRAVLSEAFDNLAAEPAEEPVAEPAPVEAVEAVDTEPAADAELQAESSPERARDESGRFAKAGEKPAPKKAPAPPKGGEKAERAAVAGPQGKPAGAPSPSALAGQPAPVKAPQSWTPAAREAFAKAPPEVQKEVDRREREMARTLQETAEARKTAETVHKTLAPYETIARANGMDSMQYAGSVLQTAAALQMGTPQQRAAVVAQIIGMYGVDVESINAAMQGQAPRQAAPQPQPQDVSKLVQQEWDRRMGEAQQAKAAQAWQEFNASEPEFLENVREEMADILELAGRRGRNVTYQQAYDKACQDNPEIRAILEQRKAAEAAKAQQASTQRARQAASSVRSTPAVAASTQPADRRAVLAQKYDEIASR